MATWLAETCSSRCVYKQILIYWCACVGAKLRSNAPIVDHTQSASPRVTDPLCSAGGARHVHQCKWCESWPSGNSHIHIHIHIHSGSGQPVESIRTDTWPLKALEHSPVEWWVVGAFIRLKAGAGGGGSGVGGGGGGGFRKQMLSRKASTKLSLNYTGCSPLPSYFPDINQDILQSCSESQVHSQAKSYLPPPPPYRIGKEKNWAAHWWRHTSVIKVQNYLEALIWEVPIEYIYI